MKLMVSSYNNGGTVWNAEAEETKFRSYTIDHGFNGPARATITLADVDGTIMQKYNADANDVYLGVGKITIEDPTGTDIFYGRIKKVTGDSERRTVTLDCYDWLDQLDDEHITYDMREDLDGSGLRQSKGTTDPTESFIRHPALTTGTNYFFVDEDMAGNWSADQFNSKKLVFTAGMAGTNTWKIGPYTETVTPSAAPMAVDTFQGGTNIGDLWVDNSIYHSLSDAADYYVTYGFKVWVPDSSSWFSSLTGARIRIKYQSHEDFGVTLQVNSGGYNIIGELAQKSTTTIETRTFEIPEELLAALFDANGEGQVRVDVAEATGGAIRIYWIEYEVDTVTSGYSSTISISDTMSGSKNPDSVQSDDGGVFTDMTTEATNDPVETSDVVIFPTVPVANDAFYIGDAAQFFGLLTRIGIANDWTGTVIWEYWDGAAWSSLPNLSPITSAHQEFEYTGSQLFTWTDPGDWVTVAVNGTTKYWIRVRVSAVTAPPTAGRPRGTTFAVLSGDVNLLKVGTDLTTDATKIWEGIPYCIAKEIYLHLESATGPILGGDGIVTLTAGAANIENTSGVSTRQYKEQTRLEILQDLAAQDKSLFWITLGGVTVTYKQTFGADTMQLTDGKVNSWQSYMDYGAMYNEYHVYGARLGDYEISQVSTDTTSETKFLSTKTKVLRNTGLVSDTDAKAIGTALAARDAEPSLMVGCTIAGNTATAAHATTIKLGEIVEITSSYLWPTAAKDYIVTRWAYDSEQHETYLTLHPKVSIGMQEIESPVSLGLQATENTRRGSTDKYVPDPVTHEVS
jgi:hypothetical protein